MPHREAVRPVVPADVPALRQIVDATLFPAEMLGDMIAPFFQQAGCTDIWLTCDGGGEPVAVAFCEAERSASELGYTCS